MYYFGIFQLSVSGYFQSNYQLSNYQFIVQVFHYFPSKSQTSDVLDVFTLPDVLGKRIRLHISLKSNLVVSSISRTLKLGSHIQIMLSKRHQNILS